MSARNGRLTRLCPPSDVDDELMGAADAIADMAQRVQLNGPEPTYASEKLSHACTRRRRGSRCAAPSWTRSLRRRAAATGMACGSRRRTMTLNGVKSGDIVLCDRMGRVFYAIVVERHDRELEVDPIDRRVTYRRVKAREVLGIWRKSRAQNGRVADALRAAS